MIKGVNMNYPRLILAAPKSGSGKTTVTCGVLSSLKLNNVDVCSFKCGPDYIDPMFHRKVLGISAGNLDTFFTSEKETRQLFVNEFSGELAVIEGVMGLYDGLGGTELTGSTYDLAMALGAPIVMVIDAKGAGRSVLAEIKGFLDYDTEGLIKGVILNRTSRYFADILGPMIEKELGIKSFGYVENSADIEIDSRHLGLVIPEEISDIQQKLQEQGRLISQGIDLNGLIELGKAAVWEFDEVKAPKESALPKVRIAVARDEAFCFYYKENMELLEKYGAELVFFSPIRDKSLPEGVLGLILGGGYPENYLKDLSENKSMRADIREKLENGMHVLAECGGFMYLLDSIADKDGQEYEMAGYIPGKAFWKGKLVRFGYVNLTESGLDIKGHEFHYFDTDNNGRDVLATKPVGERSWRCMHHKGASFIGFPHLYYPSDPDFVKSFIDNCLMEK